MSVGNPAAIIFDINGNPVGVSGSMAIPSGALGQLMAGVNNHTGLVEYLSSSNGAMLVTTSGPLGVTASATLPVQGVAGGAPLQIWSEGNVGVSGTVTSVIGNWPATLGISASAQLPVFSSGPVGVTASVQLPVFSSGPVGISSSFQLPVFSTGPVGVSSSAAIPVFVTGSVGVLNVAGAAPISITGSIGVGNLFTGVPSPLAPITAPANIQDTIGWSVSLTGSLSASNGQIMPLKSDFQGNVAMREQFAPVAEDNFNGVIATALLPTTASIYAPSFSGSLNQMPGGSTPTIVKSSPGVLYKAWATNRTSGSVYLQVFNSATAPAAGAVPLFSWIVVPTSVSSSQTCASEPIIDFSPWGAFFSTGIAVSFSTTPGTYSPADNYGTGQFSGDSAFMWK